jgi:DNA invertase Pin-like site-specific DNA recombinase
MWGDFLLIEDMDRLTREQMSDALKLVTGILEAGVTICVLNQGWEITLDTFNRDASQAFMLVGAIQRANGESRRKSELLTQSAVGRRKRLREHGIPFTTQGVPWVDWNGEKWVLNKNAETVRLIFEWAADGVGTYVIARMLNNAASRLSAERSVGAAHTSQSYSATRRCLAFTSRCAAPRTGTRHLMAIRCSAITRKR